MHIEENNVETCKMGKDISKIDAVIESLARAYGWTDKLNEHKVLSAYKELVDEKMFEATESAIVKDRILRLKYKNAAARNEMQYKLAELKKKINDKLKIPYLSDIYLY